MVAEHILLKSDSIVVNGVVTSVGRAEFGRFVVNTLYLVVVVCHGSLCPNHSHCQFCP